MTDTTYDTACRMLSEFAERDDAAKANAERAFPEVALARKHGFDASLGSLEIALTNLQAFRRGAVGWDLAFAEASNAIAAATKTRQILERAAREATEAA